MVSPIGAFWMLILLFPGLLFAQDSGKELLLFLDVDADCASLDDDAYLCQAITDRIPNAFIIRNQTVVPDWSILWGKTGNEDACVITIFRGATRSRIKIGPNADENEIDAAASQVVWISSFAEDERMTIPPETKNEKIEPEAKIDPPEVTPSKPSKVKEGPKPDDASIDSTNKLKTHNSKLAYDHIDLSLSLVPGIEFYTNETLHYRGVPALSLNIIGGSHIGLRGVEVGVLWNHKSEFVSGVQIAAGANISNGPVDGVQIALVNIAGQNSEGLQLGLTNFAEDLNGLQVGLFNWGSQTEVQIGIINIAEKSDFSLGIFNLNWGYALHPVLWFGTNTQLTAGVQHGAKNLKYSLLGSFYFPDDAIQIGGGLGYHSGGKYFFTVDLFAYQLLFLGDEIWKLSFNTELKVSAGYRISERLSVFMGTSVNGLISSLPGAERVFPNAVKVDIDGTRRLYLSPNSHVGMSF